MTKAAEAKLKRKETLTQGTRRLHAQKAKQRDAIEAEEDREYELLLKARKERAGVTRRSPRRQRSSGDGSGVLLLVGFLVIVVTVRIMG